MIEGYKYPFYGSQWHPEKNVFEWSLAENLNHDAHAVSITQATADFFVNEGESLHCGCHCFMHCIVLQHIEQR
jgi:gamma-glutamyl hydrolase